MNKLTFLVFPVLPHPVIFTELNMLHFLFAIIFFSLYGIQKLPVFKGQFHYKIQPSGFLIKVFRDLVTAFMIVLSLESLQRTSELRDSIMVLERQMEAQPDSVSLKEISHKRSELLTFESVISGQLPVLEAFIAAEKAQLKSGKIQEYLLSAKANLQATNNSLDWLEGRIDVLRSIYDMRSQERINRRLGRLTIVSAIFLPMTFLAGIWGMNFKYMPLLNEQIGIFIAIGSMFLIAVGIYLYFKKNKWLD